MHSSPRCGLRHPSDGCCSQHPCAQPDERQPVNHPTAEVDDPDRHAGHEAGHDDGDRAASRNNSSPSARRPVHDPTDAEQREAGQTPDDQPAPTSVSTTSGATSAKRGTAKASYHQYPVMNIVPTTAAPKARAPNAPALRASRSYRTTSAITRSAKPRIDTTLLTAWVVVRTYALRVQSMPSIRIAAADANGPESQACPLPHVGRLGSIRTQPIGLVRNALNPLGV